uniref:Obtusifoliol 14-alpha demethylase n=1 Tax=Leersia perrieri TaxID=77586 RepID=A0A0D9X0F6_9ORYZ
MDRFNSSQAGSLLLQALPVRVGMDMTAAAVWSAIAVLLTTVVVYKMVMPATTTKKNNAGDDAVKKPPRPPSVSAASLLIPAITKGPKAVIGELYAKLGSVFTVSFFGMKKVTFLVGPEVLGDFFSRLESEVHQGDTYKMTVPMFGKGVMYDVDVATRSEQIAVTFEALRPTKLRTNAVSMVRETEEYFAKWGEEGTVDLKFELDVLVLTISGRILLGKEVRETMFDDFVKSFHDLMDNSMHVISLYFPNIPVPWHRRRNIASARLKELFARAIDLRRASGRVEDDLLQRFLESKYRDGRPMSDNEITGMLIALVVGGQHTSYSTLTWTGAFLLTNPKHMSAVVDEQKRLIARHGAEHIDYAVLAEMETLHYCIKEALRMHPPVPVVIRSVRKGFVVRTREGKEYDVPKGHGLMCYTGFNHRLSHIYREPDVYDPERFGAERKEDKVAGKFSFTAFGGGRHACLGESYAFLQMKAVWSHLLRNFELELLSPFPKLEVNNLLPGPGGKVMVRYKRRKLTATT